MELEGGMVALGSEVSPALFHEGSVSIMLQSKEFENMIRKCYVANMYLRTTSKATELMLASRKPRRRLIFGPTLRLSRNLISARCSLFVRHVKCSYQLKFSFLIDFPFSVSDSV